MVKFLNKKKKEEEAIKATHALPVKIQTAEGWQRAQAAKK